MLTACTSSQQKGLVSEHIVAALLYDLNEEGSGFSAAAAAAAALILTYKNLWLLALFILHYDHIPFFHCV